MKIPHFTETGVLGMALSMEAANLASSLPRSSLLDQQLSLLPASVSRRQPSPTPAPVAIPSEGLRLATRWRERSSLKAWQDCWQPQRLTLFLFWP